jgi:hypothetical protein
MNLLWTTNYLGNNIYVDPSVIQRPIINIEHTTIFVCNHYFTLDPWCVESPGFNPEDYDVDDIMES